MACSDAAALSWVAFSDPALEPQPKSSAHKAGTKAYLALSIALSPFAPTMMSWDVHERKRDFPFRELAVCHPQMSAYHPIPSATPGLSRGPAWSREVAVGARGLSPSSRTSPPLKPLQHRPLLARRQHRPIGNLAQSALAAQAPAGRRVHPASAVAGAGRVLHGVHMGAAGIAPQVAVRAFLQPCICARLAFALFGLSIPPLSDPRPARRGFCRIWPRAKLLTCHTCRGRRGRSLRSSLLRTRSACDLAMPGLAALPCPS